MLVLFRKPKQQIIIGDRIIVTLVALRNGGARIGVDAPKDVPVHRREVFEAIQKGEGK